MRPLDIANTGARLSEISFDHDIIDGAPATRFSQRLKDLIERGYGLVDQAPAPDSVVS